MSDRGSIVHYLYWSRKRIEGILDDNNIRLRPPGQSTFGANVAGITAQRTNPDRPPSRDEIARAVEKGLGPSIVSTFDRPDRTLFARGRGTVTFGEFVGID